MSYSVHHANPVSETPNFTPGVRVNVDVVSHSNVVGSGQGLEPRMEFKLGMRLDEFFSVLLAVQEVHDIFECIL